MTFCRLFTILLLLVVPAVGQETPPPDATTTTAPTTTQAANRQASPRSAVNHFLESVEAGNLDAACECLNNAVVDTERWQQNRHDYVRQLSEILNELEARGLFDPDQLPGDPATDPAPIIGNADVALTLQRIEDRNAAGEPTGRFKWVFSAGTVKDLPELYERLDRLDTPEPPAETGDGKSLRDELPPGDFDQLLQPATMLRYFLNQQVSAQNDTTAYRKAMACIDFGQTIDDLATDGPPVVNQLAQILGYLMREEGFEPRTFQAPADSDIASISASGEGPLAGVELKLVRKADGAWLFQTETARNAADWAARVQKFLAGEGKAADLTSIPTDTSTPQATMNLFLQAMSRQDLGTAVEAFERRGLQNTDPTVLHSLAGKLWLVLNRFENIDLRSIPARLDGDRFPILTHIAGRVELVRVQRDDGREEWLFPPSTIRAIDALYAAYESRPLLEQFRDARISFWALPALYIREYLVPDSYKRGWNGLQVWQWYGIAFTLLCAVLAYVVASRLLPPLVRRVLSTRDAVIMPATVRRSLRPLFFLAATGTITLGLRLLDLGADTMSWVLWTLRMVATVLGVWAAYQIIDLGTAFFSVVASRTRSRLDDVLVPLIQKTLKVVAAAIGGIIVVNAFGFNVGPLLAGLGVGGLAFGLAAQDTLKNFFGSVNVVLDRPFQVGDWVRVGDTEGTIEAVGLRSTRIRTFYNSEITVPNSNLMTTAIDNMGRRRYRRISTKLGVLYSTTPEQLDAFCEGIRELVRLHPYTRKDYFHVYVNEFAASSINILLYVFHECPDWSVELRERHRLFLDIIRLANRLGVEFAFPTQTVHLHHDTNPDTPPPSSPSIPIDRSAAEVFGKDQATAILHDFPARKDE